MSAICAVFLLILLFAGSAAAGDRIIVIDAGHGGSKPSGTQAARTLSSPNNAVSPGGLKEKDLTLELALLTKTRVAAFDAIAAALAQQIVAAAAP